MRIQIGDQHFARTETAAMDNLLRIEVYQTGFRTGDYERVFGQKIAARAEAVTVERHTHQVAVGKRQRGGAVPGFDAVCVVAKKS